MNEVGPQAWLADVLTRIAEHPVHRIDELLPSNWRKTIDPKKARSLTAKGRSVGLWNTEKVVITATCQRFIDEVLKPRFLPAIRPTQFNYPIDILGKWHGNHYRSVQRYRSGQPGVARLGHQDLPQTLTPSRLLSLGAYHAQEVGLKLAAFGRPYADPATKLTT
jgi:hypothetical protein